MTTRAINHGAVVAATIRETPRHEFERRVGQLREVLAIWRDRQEAETMLARVGPLPPSYRLSRFKMRLKADVTR